jgi:hypothetical protein
MSKKYGHTDIESEPLTEREREEYREMTGRPFVYEAPTWWDRMREKMQKARKRNPDNDTHPTVAYPRGGGVRAGGERSPKRDPTVAYPRGGARAEAVARWRAAERKAGQRRAGETERQHLQRVEEIYIGSTQAERDDFYASGALYKLLGGGYSRMQSPKRAAKKSSRAVSKGCKSTRRARWREAVKKAGAPKGSTLAARRAALAKAHALYKAPRCKVRKRRGKKRARR